MNWVRALLCAGQGRRKCALAFRGGTAPSNKTPKMRKKRGGTGDSAAKQKKEQKHIHTPRNEDTQRESTQSKKGLSVSRSFAQNVVLECAASKTSSSPLLSSFATGLTSSRDSSSIVAKELVSDDSDDEDVEYKGHFCSGCSIPPPGGVRGWVRGYGGVGLWEAGPGCACCEDYD